MAFKFDVEALREQFPACDLQINGTPIAYLDGPGGTQVPYSVLDAITGYMIYDNANEDGNFRAGLKQGDIEIAARQAGADFLGCDVDEVGYNCSSTQNNYLLLHRKVCLFALSILSYLLSAKRHTYIYQSHYLYISFSIIQSQG